MNMKFFRVLLVGVLVSLVGAAFAQSPKARFLSSNDVIFGLGEQTPNAQNHSLSDNFRVYKFVKHGITYIQINTLDNEVLTAIGLASGQSFTLPIGILNSGQVSFSSNKKSGSGFETTNAECPCSAQVVYQDSNVTIVVVYGAGGEVIEVVVINHHQQEP